MSSIKEEVISSIINKNKQVKELISIYEEKEVEDELLYSNLETNSSDDDNSEFYNDL